MFWKKNVFLSVSSAMNTNFRSQLLRFKLSIVLVLNKPTTFAEMAYNPV
jgi:hypothetical protein